MATSKITFYRTELTPERNAFVEDLHEYLVQHAVQTYTADNFQYQKIQLDIIVNIAVDQEKVGDQSLGNYCELVQDNRTFYFFIMNAEWASNKAVKVALSLDTINTFGEELEFSSKTSIQRQHMDRLHAYSYTGVWEDGTGEKEFYRIIDKTDEGIQLPMHQENTIKLRDAQGDFNWYLIYNTRNDLTPTDISNPIQCGLIADRSLLYKEGTTENPPVTITPQDLTPGKYYFLDSKNNVDFEWRAGNYGNEHRDSEPPVIDVFSKYGDNRIKAEHMTYQTSGDGYIFVERYTYSIDISEIKFYIADVLTVSSSNLNSFNDIANLSEKLPIKAGKQEPQYILGINEIDKSDTRLMKIIKLPYCPVNVSVNQKGEYVFPNEWTYKLGIMRLDRLSKEFEHRIANIDLKPILTFKDTVTPKTIKSSSRESKLYNSQFYTYKFNYDSFNKMIPLENVEITNAYDGGELPILVDFKPTNTINSKFAFKFDTTTMANANYDFKEDYENYLIVNRNNEEPIFSNDYVNYIRNGYNYDQKAKFMSLGQNIFSTVTGFGQAGAALGIEGISSRRETEYLKRLARKTPRSGIGESLLKNKKADISPFLSSTAINAGFGAINNIASTVTSWVGANDSIKQKLDQLSLQSSNVTGSDDVDLLSYYNKNRLWQTTYNLEELPKKSLNNLFYYTGYSHPVQEVPNINSRYWFNFIQCDPVFKNENTSVYSKYLEDIKYRFSNGVTYFHHHPEIDIGWDLDQEYENWEKSFFNPTYLPTFKVTAGVNNFTKVTGSQILNWHLIRPLANIDEFLQFKFKKVGGNEGATGTNTDNQQSIILRNWDEDMTTVQVRRVNRWNIDFSSDWRNII